MDIKAIYMEAAEHFGHGVAEVKSDQWDQPTPDAEWSVRDLVNHVTSETLWIPELLAGRTIAEVGDKYDGDVLGEDPAAAWQGACERAVAAVKALTDLDGQVHLSFGDTKASEYVGQMIIDTVIHSWDLAQGTKNLGGGPSPTLVKAAYELLVPQAEAWRSSGAFAPQIEVPVDAAIGTKLLALSGRKA